MDVVIGLLVFLHVLGAIAAFGPTFAFPIIGPMAGREPQHANFTLRLQEAIITRLVVPLAIVQGITGLLIVAVIGFDLLRQAWLLIAIVLYLIALAISLGVALPNLRRLLAATSAPPPPRPEGAPAPSGPPPHIAAMVARSRQLGMAQAVLIVLIVFLMVTGSHGFLAFNVF